MICLQLGAEQSHKSQNHLSRRTTSPQGQRTPSPDDRQSLNGSPMRRSSSGSLSPRSPKCTSPMTVEDDGKSILSV